MEIVRCATSVDGVVANVANFHRGEVPDGYRACPDWVGPGCIDDGERFTRPPGPSLGEVQGSVLLQIDRDVDDVYDAVLGRREPEYTRAETEALSFQTAGYSGPVPPSVASWAIEGRDAVEAADDILAQAATWRTAQAAIRAQRLASKATVRAAATHDDLVTALATWTAFLAQMRALLGAA